MQTKIAEVVHRIRPSVIRDMALRAEKLDNVISLGIGEPDFHTAPEISRLALQDAEAGYTHYTPSKGYGDLVEALCEYLNRYFGHGVSPEQVAVTSGGMGALTAYFRALLNPGEEVLVPEPYFPSYRPQIEWAGGQLVPVPTSFEQGFVLTPEAVERAITPRTKVLMINSPHNPTGLITPPETLDDLAYLAKEKDLLVLSDEVYDRLVFDGRRHDSIFHRPGMRERTTVLGSFSKSFAMTGWRLGYAFGPEWLVKEMVKVLAHYTSCPPSVSQRAGLAALRQAPSLVDDMAAEFEKRRDLLYEKLLHFPGVKIHKPTGAFYAFPNLEAITDNTEQFALDLLYEERVVVIPGGAFGASGQQCVRMAFTVDCDRLTEALNRFSRFIAKKMERKK